MTCQLCPHHAAWHTGWCPNGVSVPEPSTSIRPRKNPAANSGVSASPLNASPSTPGSNYQVAAPDIPRMGDVQSPPGTPRSMALTQLCPDAETRPSVQFNVSPSPRRRRDPTNRAAAAGLHFENTPLKCFLHWVLGIREKAVWHNDPRSMAPRRLQSRRLAGNHLEVLVACDDQDATIRAKITNQLQTVLPQK
jgi:hypothetical protein